MVQKMFVIFDSKASCYFPPWFLHRDEMAVRTFMDCVNDPKHNFGMHPEDYTLFSIGEFEDCTAMVQSWAPVSLGNGVEFIKADSQPDLFVNGPMRVDPKDYDAEDLAMLAERKLEKCNA